MLEINPQGNFNNAISGGDRPDSGHDNKYKRRQVALKRKAKAKDFEVDTAEVAGSTGSRLSGGAIKKLDGEMIGNLV